MEAEEHVLSVDGSVSEPRAAIVGDDDGPYELDTRLIYR